MPEMKMTKTAPLPMGIGVSSSSICCVTGGASQVFTASTYHSGEYGEVTGALIDAVSRIVLALASPVISLPGSAGGGVAKARTAPDASAAQVKRRDATSHSLTAFTPEFLNFFLSAGVGDGRTAGGGAVLLGEDRVHVVDRLVHDELEDLRHFPHHVVG